MKVKLVRLASVGFVADALTTWLLVGKGPLGEINPVLRGAFSAYGLTLTLALITGVRVGATYGVLRLERWFQPRVKDDLNRITYMVLLIMCVIAWLTVLNNLMVLGGIY